MELNSKTTPLYLPEPNQNSVLRLGLNPLHHKDWLVVDEDFLQFQQHKLKMEQEHFEKVYQALPSSAPAQKEFTEHLLSYLQTHHPHQFDIEADQLTHIDTGKHWRKDTNSLWHSSQWIQEDICLIEESKDGYVLSAASLCSPTHWNLEEKIGHSVSHIHEPVPGYEAELAVRVNKLLAAIKPDKPMMRYNWSLQPNNELCWREDYPQKKSGLHWRIERQTLLRLPRTRAVVFTIRIFIHSAEAMNQHCKFRKDLELLISRLPKATRDYKGLDEYFELFS